MERLAESMGAAMRRVSRAYEAALFDLKVSASQFLVLDQIGPGRPQAEITTRLGLAAPTVARALGDLEDRGWINRARNADDSRRVDVSMTDAGRRVYIEARHRVEDVDRRLTAPFDPQVAAQFGDFLKTIGGAQ